MGSIALVAKHLLEPHVRDIEFKMRPGLVTHTWTSMNIDAYKTNVMEGLGRLEELINNINDVIESRIEHNLKRVGRTLLVDLPTIGF